MRKSEMRLESALSRWAAMRSREGGIADVSIISAALGGSEMAFSINWRALFCSRRREMEERTVEQRRLE